jgi:membrane fusion protein (multidrug efflux system)
MVQPGSKKDMNIKILRAVWGKLPWLLVIILIITSLTIFRNVWEERNRIEEARKAAIKQNIPAVKVIILSLEAKRLEDKINLPATVEPYENLWVKTEVSGQVVNILVKEGQNVEKGQLLVELDARDYKARLEQVEANYRLALMDYERLSTLAEKKIIAKTELDKTEAQLKSLAAQLDEAELGLERTRIRAPISGRLNEIEAKTGDWLGVDSSVAQILQFEEVKVTVGVPESDVAAILDLNEADVIIEALGNLRVKGKKLFLSRQPGTMARLYDLELLVENTDGRILPGMFGRVELVKEVFEEALVIPLYAVISQDDENFVFVEKDKKAEKRHVELGILSGWQVQVTAGLEPGDQVIIVGHRQVEEGQDVDVIQRVEDAGEIL